MPTIIILITLTPLFSRHASRVDAFVIDCLLIIFAFITLADYAIDIAFSTPLLMICHDARHDADCRH